MVEDSSFKEKFDVVVIGSGPTGAAAAYYLAESRVKVLILEKENLPRYKTCGGGLVYRLIENLPFNLNGVAEDVCLNAEIYDHASGLHFEVRRKNPIVVMTMRSGFDSFLIKQAKEKGAKISAGEEVVDIKEVAGGIEVRTNKKLYIAQYVIAADGATGFTARKFKHSSKIKRVPALEYEMHTDEETLLKYKGRARFDFGIVPHGYGWVFPKSGHLSVGVLSMKKNGTNLNETFSDYIKKIGLEAVQKAERHGYVIPLGMKHRKLAEGRILFCGDAAGLADPVTAEGISNSFISGRVAAEAIIEAGGSGVNPGELYIKKLNSLILKELRYADFIARLVYTGEGMRKLLFKLYGRRLSELITSIFTGEKSYKKIIGDPLNYIKLIKYLFIRF